SLLKKSRAQIFAHRHVGRKKLYCDGTLEAHVTCEIHGAHSTAAKLALYDVVRSKCFSHFLQRDHRCRVVSHLFLLELHRPDVTLCVANDEIEILCVGAKVETAENLALRIGEVNNSLFSLSIDRKSPYRGCSILLANAYVSV